MTDKEEKELGTTSSPLQHGNAMGEVVKSTPEASIQDVKVTESTATPPEVTPSQHSPQTSVETTVLPPAKQEHATQPDDIAIRTRHRHSWFSNLVFMFTIGILVIVAWFIYASWQAQDTSDIAGFRQKENAPDLPNIIRQAVTRDNAITLTEEDINRYLATAVDITQHGLFSIFATNPAIGVRLHGNRSESLDSNGHLEIVLERHTGKESRQTISLFITPSQAIDPSNYMAVQTNIDFHNDRTLPGGIRVGGTIGALDVPQGYILFLLPAFEQLYQACKPLLMPISDYGWGIQIDQGSITLTPPQKRTL